MADEPITREEQFLSAAAGNEVNLPTPITREEMYLAKAAGVNINITMLDPITRKERYLHALAEGGGSGGGGGSSVEVEALTVTQNGEYSEESKAYSPVTVNVPNTYTAGDEGKVVSNGALVSQTSDTVTQNGTVDTTLINFLLVNVSGGGGGLEYEEGTWTPTADTNHGSIPFANQHTKAPAFFAVLDTSDRSTLSDNTVYGCFYCDTYKLFGIGWPWGNTGTGTRYTAIQTLYINNGTAQYQGSATGNNSDNTGDSTANYPRYWAKETGIYPYTGNDARYYRANHTFKWIAIWMPES